MRWVGDLDPNKLHLFGLSITIGLRNVFGGPLPTGRQMLTFASEGEPKSPPPEYVEVKGEKANKKSYINYKFKLHEIVY